MAVTAILSDETLYLTNRSNASDRDGRVLKLRGGALRLGPAYLLSLDRLTGYIAQGISMPACELPDALPLNP
jgi:hypothetical protein